MSFLVLHSDWRIQDSNKAFSDLVGFSKDEITRSSPFLYGMKPTEHDNLGAMGAGQGLGEQLKFLTHVKKKDGAVMPVTVYLSQARDDKGEVTNYYAIVEPEKPGCGTPEPGMLECMTDPVILVDKDAAVVFANKEALAMLKRDASDVLGKKLIDIYKRPSYTLFYKKLIYSLNEHRPASLEDFDNRLNRWYDVRFYPCGEGMIAHFRDISLRKHQDWWLRIMMFALDRVREQVLLADASGRINYINASTLEALGYKKDEIRILRIFDVIESLSVERWAETVKQAKEEGSMRLVVTMVGKGGMTIPAQIEAYYLKFFNVEYICMVTSIGAAR